MSQKTTYEEQLATGKPLIHFTVGDSMEPLLYNRDTQVMIKAVEHGGALSAGELPLYKRPGGQYVLHRIIRVSEESYHTRGDNRCGLEQVPKDWVIGVVTDIYRKGRQIHVTDRGYRLYVWFWGMIYPVRWVGYKLRGLLRKLRRML